MGNRRVLILVIAVALAGLTAFLTFNYANTADERAFQDAELVEAFLVKKDIPKGFPGERAIDEGYIGKESIPRKFFPAKGITNAQALRGQVALAPAVGRCPDRGGQLRRAPAWRRSPSPSGWARACRPSRWPSATCRVWPGSSSPATT